jgi:hypothetical protein
MAFNWTCPYCGSKTTINDNNFTDGEKSMTIQNNEGARLLKREWIVCPNEECKRITLKAVLYNMEINSLNSQYYKKEVLKTWRLLPGSYSKAFPEYIPSALKNDYEEAAAILDLSPKASATLARSCLQGMIRDFWKVSKSRLIDEVNAIEDKIDPLTWKSIDAVRKVGNIGAHMEKDINLIIDVDPQEAYLLIQLIELLFEEWYIHRHERELKLTAIVELAHTKEEKKKK